MFLIRGFFTSGDEEVLEQVAGASCGRTRHQSPERWMLSLGPDPLPPTLHSPHLALNLDSTLTQFVPSVSGHWKTLFTLIPDPE